MGESERFCITIRKLRYAYLRLCIIQPVPGLTQRHWHLCLGLKTQAKPLSKARAESLFDSSPGFKPWVRIERTFSADKVL